MWWSPSPCSPLWRAARRPPSDRPPHDRERAPPPPPATEGAAGWPPQTDAFNHEYATINGLRYHYVHEGSGPPLLLVHGWPGFYYEWHLNIRPLAERFELVVPDMRGYAYTDKPDE